MGSPFHLSLLALLGVNPMPSHYFDGPRTINPDWSPTYPPPARTSPQRPPSAKRLRNKKRRGWR